VTTGPTRSTRSTRSTSSRAAEAFANELDTEESGLEEPLWNAHALLDGRAVERKEILELA
jgi:hypothetical protein